MDKCSETIKEILLIMKDNQYNGGKDSNKRTVIRVDEYLNTQGFGNDGLGVKQ